jgi:hypothetical protein
MKAVHFPHTTAPSHVRDIRDLRCYYPRHSNCQQGLNIPDTTFQRSTGTNHFHVAMMHMLLYLCTHMVQCTGIKPGSSLSTITNGFWFERPRNIERHQKFKGGGGGIAASPQKFIAKYLRCHALHNGATLLPRKDLLVFPGLSQGFVSIPQGYWHYWGFCATTGHNSQIGRLSNANRSWSFWLGLALKQ